MAHYGRGTNTLAEILALKDGLRLCRDLNISRVLVERDSEVVVMAIRACSIGNWRLEYSLRDCLNLLPISFEIIHGYRQKNQVVYRLAAAAHRVRTRMEFFGTRIYLHKPVGHS